MTVNRNRGAARYLIIGIVILLVAAFLVPACLSLPPFVVRVTCFALALVGMTVSWGGVGVLITGQKLGLLWTARNVYSLARLQMALWSVVILSGLVAVAACRAYGLFPGGSVDTALNVNLPPELLQAMGISLLSGALAPAVLSLKAQGAQPSASDLKAAASRMQQHVASAGRVFVRPGVAGPMLTDLLQGDDVATAGTVDLSKLQQLTVTCLLVCTYMAMLFRFFAFGDSSAKSATEAATTLPALSQSFVYLMGVSHAGYLAYKAAPTVTPPATPQAQSCTPATSTNRPPSPSRF